MNNEQKARAIAKARRLADLAEALRLRAGAFQDREREARQRLREDRERARQREGRTLGSDELPERFEREVAAAEAEVERTTEAAAAANREWHEAKRLADRCAAFLRERGVSTEPPALREGYVDNTEHARPSQRVAFPS